MVHHRMSGSNGAGGSTSPGLLPKRGRGSNRVGMACIPCRLSKLRCDGAKPACQRCSDRKQSCFWATLDGRSTAAKRARPSSQASTADRSIDQLELLANAAVKGAAFPSFYPLQEPIAPPSTPSSRSYNSILNMEARLSSAMTAPSSAYTAPTFSTANMPDNAAANPAPPIVDIGAQQMWWERGVPLGGRIPVPSVTSDPLATIDWSSLGLQPQQMTDEMVDMLLGKVVWVDQPKHDATMQPSNCTTASSATTPNEQGFKKPEVVRVQYFRLLGPTGISPGIKKISMELKLTPSVRKALLFDSSSPSTARQGGAQRVDWEMIIAGGGAANDAIDAQSSSEDDAGIVAHGLPSRPDLFDGDIPAPWVLSELLPIFFERLGDHYLCLNRAGLEARLGFHQSPDKQRPVPPMLINILCALAARFSNHPHIVAGRSPHRAHTFGKRFARKAKDFLATSLAVPSRTTILAFLMMAWHEFACNLDSAFWNYGGMALRMAIDLGLQRYSPNARGPRDLNDTDLIDDPLLFWAVYQMDRILVVGTGRPTSIKDREITSPMPNIEDVSGNNDMIFGYYIRHVRIGGRVAETINAVLSPDEDVCEEIQKQLDSLEAQLIESYESIPARLCLNTANFKATDQKHLFLEFHLWFHNLLFILNRSPIVEMRKTIHPFDALKVVRKSVQRCADVVALDDSYDNQILESVPMANQTLFLAGCAELEECQQHKHAASPAGNVTPRSTRHLMREAEEGYRKFASALERISIYWDGVRWIHGVLTQRQMGRSHTDLVELAVGTDALVSKREMQLLQRLSTGGNGARTSSTSTSLRGPVEISEVGSLDELASLLPQVQALLGSQPHGSARQAPLG